MQTDRATVIACKYEDAERRIPVMSTQNLLKRRRNGYSYKEYLRSATLDRRSRTKSLLYNVPRTVRLMRTWHYSKRTVLNTRYSNIQYTHAFQPIIILCRNILEYTKEPSAFPYETYSVTKDSCWSFWQMVLVISFITEGQSSDGAHNEQIKIM